MNSGAGRGVSDLPPSASYVYHLIRAEDGMARQELLERVDLPESTVDDAVSLLKTRRYIVETRDSGDLRRVVYETRRYAEI